ncbi:phytanoyl-CoA dioxygenase family protein [Candidatus Pelagibacter ubique]|nr:phytanoyl-CoA dioxygenase family protein [Candidatus Pelagibacter ubique]
MNSLKCLKNHYDEKGWVVYKNLFSIKQIHIINSIIDNFLKEKIKSINKVDRTINFVNNNKRIVKNINSFHKLAESDKIKNYAQKKSVLDIAKVFLNSDPEFRGCELFAKPAMIGLPSPSHQDNYYWAVKGANALTIWIALNISNKNNGCVYYYDGSHKYGTIKHQPSFAKGSSQKISDIKFLQKFKISYPELKLGDALIHHSQVVHGSLQNISKSNRRGWTIQFKDKNASYDLEQIKKYEKSLNDQILLSS